MKRRKMSIFILAILSLPLILLFTNCSSLVLRDSKNIPICFQYVFANDLAQLKRNSEKCINFETDNHITTLMLAASKGNKEMVLFLADNGANLDVRNEIGHSALAFAVIQNKPEIVKILIEHGAQIISDNDGISTVMMAIQFGRFEILKMLNPSERDVNLKADDGWTALYFSIRNENIEILDYLLAKGACPNVVDTYSQSPLDFARESRWKASYSRLKKARHCDTLTANP